MTFAITDDHAALAEVVTTFLHDHKVLTTARALLDGEADGVPAFWGDIAELGWLGLHVPEDEG